MAALVLASGCASVTRGTKDTLVVESEPAGANVRLSTGGIGKTPTSFQLPRKKMLDVFIEKEGYEPLTVHVSSQVSGTGAVGVAGNVLIGGLVGIGIDTWTGAAKDLRPNPIKVVMVPRKMVAPLAQGTAVASTEAKPAADAMAPASPAGVVHGGASGGPGEIIHHAEYQPTGTQVGTLRMPRRMEPAQVQDAIAAVFRGRGWDVTEKADDHMIGHIKHRSTEAVLTVVYDADLIQLYCEGWKIDKQTGAHLKPELPDSWIENVRNDLNERLAQTTPSS